MPVPVFVGFEVVGHPMPDRAHRSPVAVGGGGWVVPVSVFVGFEVVGHPMSDRAHRSPVVVGVG